jgi:hypothetical protein
MSNSENEKEKNNSQGLLSANSSEVKKANMDNEISPSVDKIRDIIFGGQMRDYEARFSALEARISKESARLRQDLEIRMDSLENLLQNEFESISNKLMLEKKERSESLLSTENSLKKNHDFLNQRLTELENKYLEEIRKLRNQEHDDVKALRSAIHELRQEITSQLEKEIETLRKTKVDKASVAALFAAGNS